MSLVSKRCERCKYVGEILFGEPCCDYMLITGKPRNCPAGDECIRYVGSRPVTTTELFSNHNGYEDLNEI